MSLPLYFWTLSTNLLFFVNSWYSYRTEEQYREWYFLQMSYFFFITVTLLYTFMESFRLRQNITFTLRKVKKNSLKGSSLLSKNRLQIAKNFYPFVGPTVQIPQPNIVYSPYTQNIHTANFVNASNYVEDDQTPPKQTYPSSDIFHPKVRLFGKRFMKAKRFLRQRLP